MTVKACWLMLVFGLWAGGSFGAVPLDRPECNLYPLHCAVLDNLPETVERLLTYGHLPTQQDPFGNTPLHCAATSPNSALLALLVPGVDVFRIDIKNQNGVTALMLAAQAGRVENTKILLQSNANVMLEDGHGKRAVHYGLLFPAVLTTLAAYGEPLPGSLITDAAKAGSLAGIDFFVARGEKIDALDKHDYNLIHYAVFGNQGDIIPELVRRGLNMNQRGDWGSPLDIAMSRGLRSAVKALCRLGAKIDWGKEYMWWALRFGMVENLQALAECGINLNALIASSYDFVTPLQYIAKNWRDLTNPLKLAAALLELGADPNFQVQDGNNETNAFTAAVDAWNFEYMEFLLQHGANPNAHLHNRWDGESSLLVLYEKEPPVLRLLLRYGAKQAEADPCGSLVHRAIYAGSEERLQILISNSNTINTPDCNQVLPVEAVSQMWQGDFESMFYLVKRLGGNFDVLSKNGLPLAFVAAKRQDRPGLLTGLIFLLYEYAPSYKDFVDPITGMPFFHYVVSRDQSPASLEGFLRSAKDRGLNFAQVDAHGDLPLHVGLRANCDPTWVDYYPDLNIPGANGQSPLQACKQSGKATPEAIQKLIDRGARESL